MDNLYLDFNSRQARNYKTRGIAFFLFISIYFGYNSFYWLTIVGIFGVTYLVLSISFVNKYKTIEIHSDENLLKYRSFIPFKVNKLSLNRIDSFVFQTEITAHKFESLYHTEIIAITDGDEIRICVLLVSLKNGIPLENEIRIINDFYNSLLAGGFECKTKTL